jgi:hypothetical protein
MTRYYIHTTRHLEKGKDYDLLTFDQHPIEFPSRKEAQALCDILNKDIYLHAGEVSTTDYKVVTESRAEAHLQRYGAGYPPVKAGTVDLTCLHPRFTS